MRRAPVTAECLIICTALFVICQARTFEGMRFLDAQRQWGSMGMLQINPRPDQPPEALHRQLRGPFDLWDGEWWRIPVSSFHHGNLLHLLMNCGSGWVLGKRLERRWGSLRFALFLVPAVTIPMLAEALAGEMAVGFSGALCAMLGALIYMQQISVEQEDDLSDEAILITLGTLLLMIPATMLDLIRIGNIAHVTGVLYGWAAAWCMCGPWSNRLIRSGFVLSHLAVIPAFWVVTNPIHSGTYLWYVAERDHRSTPARHEQLLKMALQTDPSLTGIWLRLAEYRHAEGKLQDSWALLIEGLSNNPADTDLFEAARRLWRRLPNGPARESAEAELRKVFGDRAAVWLEQIRNTGLVSTRRIGPGSAKPSEPEVDPKQFPLDVPFDLHWEPKRPAPNVPQQIDPDAPDNAVEGRAL